jgi:SAM-dependent methyltransferase
MNSKNFYNTISPFYDKMIDFNKNLDLRISAYKNIFPNKIKIADIGCGTGLDSIALLKNGHKVRSYDISPEMIKTAKQISHNYNVKISAQVGSFSEAASKSTYDAIISVGNTIAHLNKKELDEALGNCYKGIKPGGQLFLHILNYNLIKKENKRINNIAVKDNLAIIRLYDFFKDDIGFSILSFPLDKPKEFTLVSTTHYPHTSQHILRLLKKNGFEKVRLGGNFALKDFDEESSKDLFILAERSF